MVLGSQQRQSGPERGRLEHRTDLALELDLGRGAWLDYRPGFVSGHEALMTRLWRELPLVQEPLRIFGRVRATPRLTSWHGDPGCDYRYSGRRFEPQPWTPSLRALRGRLLEVTGYDFNSVLANGYRDGSDSMGAHADAEPELGPRAPGDVVVASLSLGARRRFVLQSHPRTTSEPRREVFELGAGDLLIMGGTTQIHFRHRVPKTAKTVGPRLNLTFRIIRSEWDGEW